MRLLIIGLFFAIALVSGASTLGFDAPVEEDTEIVRGGKVSWLIPQGPDAPACVRVRGDALSGLLTAGEDWAVTCAGEELPASLHPPLPLDPQTHHTLELLWQKETADGALQALLDRGADPPEIDRLKLFFAAVEVTCGVQVEYSTDRETYTASARGQAVCQRLATGVVRLSTVTIAPADKRYIRLTMPGASNTRLDRAEAWAEPVLPWRMYQLDAGVGPMHDGVPPGEHIWPLLLPDNRVPLAKLKVIADSPGTMRRLRIVRTGPDGQPRSTVTEAVWADRIQVRTGDTKLTRTEKWVFLPGQVSGDEGWAVVVEDGDTAALQVTEIQAYAADVELCFTTSDAQAPVELWLEASAGAEPHTVYSLPPTARVTGEVQALNLHREPAKTLPSITGGHDWEAGFTVIWERWHIPLYWVTAGLVALWLGLFFLQRREPDGLPD